MRTFILVAAFMLTDAIKGATTPFYVGEAQAVLFAFVVAAIFMDLLEFLKRMTE